MIYGLAKEYTLKRIRDPNIDSGMFLNQTILGSPGLQRCLADALRL